MSAIHDDQATFSEFEQCEPIAREPASLFERLTGETTTVERQQSDGDRVSEREPIKPEDGLEETISHDSEVHERR